MNDSRPCRLNSLLGTLPHMIFEKKTETVIFVNITIIIIMIIITIITIIMTIILITIMMMMMVIMMIRIIINWQMIVSCNNFVETEYSLNIHLQNNKARFMSLSKRLRIQMLQYCCFRKQSKTFCNNVLHLISPINWYVSLCQVFFRNFFFKIVSNEIAEVLEELI